MLCLSCKLVTLLALSTLFRVSEIANIVKDSIIFSEHSVFFHLSQPRKWQRYGPLLQCSLRTINCELICPVRCLGAYIGRNEALRNKCNEKSLFIRSSPFSPVKGPTMAKWIKKMLTEAGIDPSFAAHSTRSAAASKASAMGVPIETILKTASWAKESTFAKFYRRDLSQRTVADAW